jgi:hypothetical protein
MASTTRRTIASAGLTSPMSRLTIFWLAISLLGATVSAAGAVDAPVILVQADRLVPERLEVHLGEVVTWRAAGGRPLRLELDPHPAGHEIMVRAGDVRAYFRKPGEHWYTVMILNGPGKTLRGTVSVREGQAREEQQLLCGSESSGRICIEP